MKRLVLAAVLLSLGLTGCFPTDFLRTPPPVEPEPVVEVAPPVVTEDQIREDNAGDCAKAIRAELEHDLLRTGTKVPRE